MERTREYSEKQINRSKLSDKELKNVGTKKY